ncbi:MAG: 5'/3'-nucleotidase SurE [Chloroflexi bacterium]|nr:5'/3'-nucleotidase SurE [Chloroflexota bacterium]
MRVLVTNDDGISSLGLRALAVALREVGEVTTLAPDHNWSASGHNKTMHKPLRIDPVTLPDGSPAHVSSGSPSDCVALALLGFMSPPPDLVISGINIGANLGSDVHYSGTVAAAREAVIYGLPAISVSMESDEQGDFLAAAQFVARLAKKVMENGLPRGILLNVNLPDLRDGPPSGVEITRLGKRVYQDVLVERQDPRGRNYYWIGGERPVGVSEEGADVWALEKRRISITPLHLDLTFGQIIPRLQGWSLSYF